MHLNKIGKKLELNYDWFESNQIASDQLEVLRGESQVSGVKFNNWKVWELHIKLLKLESDQ